MADNEAFDWWWNENHHRFGYENYNEAEHIALSAWEAAMSTTMKAGAKLLGATTLDDNGSQPWSTMNVVTAHPPCILKLHRSDVKLLREVADRWMHLSTHPSADECKADHCHQEYYELQLLATRIEAMCIESERGS